MILRLSSQPNTWLELAASKPLLEMLERLLEFMDAIGFLSHAASIKVGDHFQAEIDCAPNSVSSQNGEQLAVIRPCWRVALSQSLNRFRSHADVIHCIAVFPDQMKVNILTLQRLFEILQLDDSFVDLQIHAPEAFVWND